MDNLDSTIRKSVKGWLAAVTLATLPLVCVASEQEKHKTPDAVVDFGWTHIDEPVRKRIELPNSGAEPLKIRNISVSCDCMNVIRYSGQIEPESSGYLDVLMLPDKTDEVNYRIHVEYDIGCHEVLFKGMVDNAADASFRGYGDLKYLLRYAASGREHRRNDDLYVDAESVTPNAIFVDVRPETAFRQVHIPGSLNIQPYALRTKTFLRGKQVVLVGMDMVGSSLEGLCWELRNSGFPGAGILDGGIGCWARAGNALAGVAPDAARSNRVTADQMRRLASSERLKIIMADKTLDIYSQVLVPRGEHVPFTEPERFAEELRAGLTDMDQAVLVITRNGRKYDEMRAMLNDSKVPVYYLDGGFKAYEARLQMLLDMEESQTATVSYMPLGKKTSGSFKGGRRVKKSCGCGG